MGKLKRVLFTEEQIKELESNSNVQKVSESAITYKPEFKLRALQAYQAGQTPSEIFIRSGFNLEVIGREKPKKSLKRWRETFNRYGEEGLVQIGVAKVAQGASRLASCRQRKN